MASSVASCDRILPTNVSNSVNFRQHFRSKEVQMDSQTVTKWSESKRFMTYLHETESDIEKSDLSDHNRNSEGLSTNGRNRNIYQNSRSFSSFFNESGIKSGKCCVDEDQITSPSRVSVTQTSKDKPEIRCSSIKNQMKPSPEKARERTSGDVLEYQKFDGMAEQPLRCNKRISNLSTYERKPNFDHALMQPQNIERNPIKSEENTLESNKNEWCIGKCEGIDSCCICSLKQIGKKKVTNADETIIIETVKPKERDAVNQEDKSKPGMKRVCRVVSLKDTEFLHRIRQMPRIFDEKLNTHESSVSMEANNSESVREATNDHNEEKKVQIESTLATPNELSLTTHFGNRKPFLSENAQNATRTNLENRVTVEVKLRVQPQNTSTLSVVTERNRGTEDHRRETARESNTIGTVFDLIEATRHLCDQNSSTSKDIQAANTYEVNWNKIATIPKERQTSMKVSTDNGESKLLSLNVDMQSRQYVAATNRDSFLEKISGDDDTEADDSSHPRDPIVLSQLTDKTSLPGFNVDEILSSGANAGEENIRNSTDSRAAIEDVERTKSEFRLDVNQKPTELRTRRRAVTIAGINPELSDIMENYNYKTPEGFLIEGSKKNDATKSEENLGSFRNTNENPTNADTEPRDQTSLVRSISLHQSSSAYGLQPRLWKLPSFRSYSNNNMIFTNDRGLLQQLSVEVKDILMADARRRRFSSNEKIPKLTEKANDDDQQQQQHHHHHHTDANCEDRTEDNLSQQNQVNSTFNDATEFQGVQPDRSNPEETADLNVTMMSPKFHYNAATDVNFPTSEESITIIQDCGSNLTKSELASKPGPSDVAFQETGKITRPKPCENHTNEKDGRNVLDALSGDLLLTKALESMLMIAASEEYLKLVDLTERVERASVLRRQRKDGRSFQPRRSLHEKKRLPSNEKLRNDPLAESSDRS